MTALTVTPLSPTIGAEVAGLTTDALLADHVAPTVHEALDRHGVLVFRALNLSPEAQVEFCRKLGTIDESDGHHPVAGIYRVTLDKTRNRSADYLQGTFDWHIDGCTPSNGEPPQMATVLSATAIAARGGDTEFASTYAAYEDLDDDERARVEKLRVVHSLEASQRRWNSAPSDDEVARWRARPSSEHPLVWTHRNDRKSLVVGTSCDHVVGMDRDEGRALLDRLVSQATRPARVYRHEWAIGDTVIWDNRGVVHRALPYDGDSGREMLRTTILGDEPIR
jgi:alpha-ketoglutarate-dependent taurine dioxygenase